MSGDEIRIGFMPLTDSAPLVVAKQFGFFEAQGLNVTLKREVSWANIRDNLIFNEIQAAHMLAPMLMASSLGVGGIQSKLVTAYSFGLNGNAVSVSNALYAQMSLFEEHLVMKPERCAPVLKKVIAQRKQSGMPVLRFAVVFPFSMHNYLLRYWLASSGIDVDRDVNITVVPPSRVVQALQEDLIDGYCVGEPWNTHAVKNKVGVTLITGYEICNNAPEKVLALKQSWAQANPDVHAKLVKALYSASEWIDDKNNRDELKRTLSAPEYVGAPVESIENALNGEVCNPSCSSCRKIEHFALPFKENATLPSQEHAIWILQQMQRWGQVDNSVNLTTIAKSVYWTDFYYNAIQ